MGCARSKHHLGPGSRAITRQAAHYTIRAVLSGRVESEETSTKLKEELHGAKDADVCKTTRTTLGTSPARRVFVQR